jgi:hypothetical protein
MYSSASQANVAWRRRERINIMKTEVMYVPRQLWVGRITELGIHAWALFSFVLQRTYGECRVSVEITNQEIMDKTGLTNKQVYRAVEKIMESDIPVGMGYLEHGVGVIFTFEDGVAEGILPAPLPGTVEEVPNDGPNACR